MDDLDPTVAERVLGEYPELLEQWRREMSRADRDDHYRADGMRPMHDPIYLRNVVAQWRQLTEGTAEGPDERLARRCEEIVAVYPPVRDERRFHLLALTAEAVRLTYLPILAVDRLGVGLCC